MRAVTTAVLKQRVLVVILGLVVMIGGLFAYRLLNIEAYPDPVPPLVDIITQNPGQSSEEIERYITIPIEIQMAGLPYVQAIRTISLFGLSDVKVQFTYDVTYQQASQMVINRLSQLGPLPNGVQPTLSPTSPIGEIFRYRIVGPPGYSIADLKTIQDWILQRRFKAIPGVTDVTGWGGKTKTYDITIDLDRLLAYGLTLKQVLDGLNNANINVGANTVNIGSQSAIVRSVAGGAGRASPSTKKAESTTCPRPLVCRANSAITVPSAAKVPASESPIEMPALLGGRSGSPVT